MVLPAKCIVFLFGPSLSCALEGGSVELATCWGKAEAGSAPVAFECALGAATLVREIVVGREAFALWLLLCC